MNLIASVSFDTWLILCFFFGVSTVKYRDLYRDSASKHDRFDFRSAFGPQQYLGLRFIRLLDRPMKYPSTVFRSNHEASTTSLSFLEYRLPEGDGWPLRPPMALAATH